MKPVQSLLSRFFPGSDRNTNRNQQSNDDDDEFVPERPPAYFDQPTYWTRVKEVSLASA